MNHPIYDNTKNKSKLSIIVKNNRKLASSYNRALGGITNSINWIETIQYYYLALLSRDCETGLTGIIYIIN